VGLAAIVLASLIGIPPALPHARAARRNRRSTLRRGARSRTSTPTTPRAWKGSGSSVTSCSASPVHAERSARVSGREVEARPCRPRRPSTPGRFRAPTLRANGGFQAFANQDRPSRRDRRPPHGRALRSARAAFTARLVAVDFHRADCLIEGPGCRERAVVSPPELGVASRAGGLASGPPMQPKLRRAPTLRAICSSLSRRRAPPEGPLRRGASRQQPWPSGSTT